MKYKNSIHLDKIDFYFNNNHFIILPAIDLNLNQKLIQNFYTLCNENEILTLISYENLSQRFTLKHAKMFLENSIKEFNKKNLTFYLVKNQIVGVFMVKDINPSIYPEIGYFLKRSERNKGLGKTFISLMVQNISYYFNGLEAIVHKNNIPSLIILKQLNFKQIEINNDFIKLRKLF
ncbi:MAG: hypothetical protein KatS3mg129_2786 [Leptospiraceae bacterium]|nr:MAG: hypothetical protein KatS3mg129_2786 [Leptospiraceae bacterium]